MNNNDEQYILKVARRAFRSFPKLEETSIKNVEINLNKRTAYLPKNGVAGISVGVAIGIIICISAFFAGIPFNGLESAFITAQFAMLGALMTYINS